MGPLRCPTCGQLRVRRCHREGPVDHALSAVYLYPFLCLVCGRRFRALRWGRRYTKQPAQDREGERVAVRAPLVVSGAGARVDGEVTGLSVQGCTAWTRVRLREGATVRLELLLEPAEPPVIVAAARVRSVRSDKAGLDFVGVSPDEELRIRRVLTTLHHVEHDERVPPTPPAQDGRLRFLRSPGFWLTTLLLVLAALVLTVFRPTFSHCVWGVSC
jgi:hypothetical protein